MTLAETLDREHSRTRMHWHALGRARERHGLDLADADLDAMVSAIRRRGPDVVTLRVDHGTSRRKVALRWRGAWLVLIYDEAYRAVVTVYPQTSSFPYQATLGRARRAIERRCGPDAPTYDELVAVVPPSELEVPGDGLPPVGTILGRVELPPGTNPWGPRYEREAAR